jgi:hypothetical protein
VFITYNNSCFTAKCEADSEECDRTLKGKSSGHHAYACNHGCIIENGPHAWQSRMVHEHNAIHELRENGLEWKLRELKWQREGKCCANKGRMERNTGEAEENLNTSDFTSFDDFIQLFKTAMIITKTSEQHQSNRDWSVAVKW